MAEIVFVKTRHPYDSYQDFWTLVSLSGFPTIFVDELDTSQKGIYITAPLNGEWEPHIDNQEGKPRRAHLIQWNLERPSGSAGSVGNYSGRQHWLIERRYFDEVWVSDRRLADETMLRFVPLGSDEGLGEPGSEEEKRYIFCHMSYEVPRRMNVFKHFYVTDIGPNCWPPERDTILKQSRFAVNVHQDMHPFQEPLRFALFAAYGLSIITESIYDSYPWSDEYMIFAPYGRLAARIKEVVEDDYSQWYEMGLRARERMTKEFRFKTMVEKAVMESTWR